MSAVNRIPKKINVALQTLVKTGIINELQKNNLIAKYISLRNANSDQVRFRKPKNLVADKVDTAIDKLMPKYDHFDLDLIVNDIKKNVQYVSLSNSMIYHRLQKRVDAGKLDKVAIQGTKKVLYALKKKLNQ